MITFQILNFEIEADATSASVNASDEQMSDFSVVSADSNDVFMQVQSKIGQGFIVRKIRELSSLFHMVDAVAVSHYLAEHPLESLLDEAHEYLRYYFPSNTYLLKMSFDPEEPTLRHLSLEIEIDRENVEIELDQLQKFRSHWWVKALKRINGRLTVSLAV